MIDRFGYLGSTADGAAALLTGKGVTAALKQFQRFVFCLSLNTFITTFTTFVQVWRYQYNRETGQADCGADGHSPLWCAGCLGRAAC